MEEQILKIEAELLAIQERNKKVEADKAWETSWFRILTIVGITYIIASLVMFLIGIANFYLNALIPTIGYLLSAQSLPVVKRWWINKRLK